jgi:hypothetical protein
MTVVVRSLVVGAAPRPVYGVRICGRQRADGTWEGWMEFDPADGSATVQTGRETTQPNLADLEYWASGLTPIYLEGALSRAHRAAPSVRVSGPDTAPPGPVRGAVLDPFAVHLRGEDQLRKQLAALSREHVLAILRAYDLEPENDANALTTSELIALIVARVSAARAA